MPQDRNNTKIEVKRDGNVIVSEPIDNEVLSVTTHVTLKPEVYDRYSSVARAKDKTINKVLADQLTKYVDSTSEKPIILSDESRRKIESVLKRNFSTADELTACLLTASRLDVSGISVQLYPKLLDRLKSRALSTPLDSFISTIIIRSLEEYVGLR